MLNKTLPRDLFSTEGAEAAARLRADADEVAGELPAVVDAAPGAVARVLRTIGTSFENFAVVARREEELRHELAVRTGRGGRRADVRERDRRRRRPRPDRRLPGARGPLIALAVAVAVRHRIAQIHERYRPGFEDREVDDRLVAGPGLLLGPAGPPPRPLDGAGRHRGGGPERQPERDQARDQERRPEPEDLREQPAEQRADRHRAPADHPVGAVHPAEQHVGNEGLAQRHGDDVPDQAGAAAERERERHGDRLRPQRRDEERRRGADDGEGQGAAGAEPGRDAGGDE